MSTKTGVTIGLILGLIIGATAIYAVVYQPTQSQLTLLIEQKTSLTTENTQLNKELTDLTTNYQNLQTQFTSKSTQLTELQIEHGKLTQEYEQAYDDWVQLSDDVMQFYQLENSYVNLEDSFQRVINKDELVKIADTIEEVSQMETDTWDAYWLIHKYVRDEVEYAYDCDIPIITTYNYYPEETDTQLTGFQTGTRRNYHQSLDFTVEFKQGDCDDQAMLEYSMIQYYRKYIYGTLYTLHLALITFNDGEAHLAVFMPVVDNQICILDPAGQYQTGSYNYIQSKKASTELYTYNDHWNEHLGIKEITLYTVNIDTGDYTELFKGTLPETVAHYSE